MNKRIITIGMAALSNQIFAGFLTKDKKRWKDGKQDVTSDVLRTIIEYVGVGQSLEVNCDGKPKYKIIVKELENES